MTELGRISPSSLSHTLVSRSCHDHVLVNLGGKCRKSGVGVDHTRQGDLTLGGSTGSAQDSQTCYILASDAHVELQR